MKNKLKIWIFVLPVLGIFLLLFVSLNANAQNYIISFSGAGASITVDSVKVENLTQCKDTVITGSNTLLLTATIVQLNELDNNNVKTLNVYPNPMTSSCLFDFEATADGQTTLELFDLTGKRIFQEQEFLYKGHHIYSIKGINSGLYCLNIKSDKFLYTARIVSCNSKFENTEIKHIEQSTLKDLQNNNLSSEKIMQRNSNKSVINMQYNSGDILKLTGKSGIYKTVNMLVPTQTQAVTFDFLACTDADNNNYSIVQIGTQLWMAENLNTAHFSNGFQIPYVMDDTQWSDLTSSAYADYNNSVNISSVYGRLYNWYAVNTGNLCPADWHVPSESEWLTLMNFTGGVNLTGGALKESCYYWDAPNIGATNETGFTALPGGARNVLGPYTDIDGYGYWWTSTPTGSYSAQVWDMRYNTSSVNYDGGSKNYGFSVRCLKD